MGWQGRKPDVVFVEAAYVEHGRFTRNDIATSAYLPGFQVAVHEALDAI